jgi:hypothetical protein
MSRNIARRCATTTSASSKVPGRIANSVLTLFAFYKNSLNIDMNPLDLALADARTIWHS